MKRSEQGELVETTNGRCHTSLERERSKQNFFSFTDLCICFSSVGRRGLSSPRDPPRRLNMSEALGAPLLVVLIALPTACTVLTVIVCICKAYSDGSDQVAPSAPPAAAPPATDLEEGNKAEQTPPPPEVPQLPVPEHGAATSALEMPTPASPVGKLPPIGTAATPLPPIKSP